MGQGTEQRHWFILLVAGAAAVYGAYEKLARSLPGQMIINTVRRRKRR